MNPPDFNLTAVSLLMPYSIFSPSWERYTYSSKQLQGTNNRQNTEREKERGEEREQIIPHQHCTWLRQLSGASLDKRTKLIKKKKKKKVVFLSCPSVRVGVRVRVCFPEQCLRCTGDLADTNNQNTDSQVVRMHSAKCNVQHYSSVNSYWLNDPINDSDIWCQQGN